jgi:hypothetical protein
MPTAPVGGAHRTTYVRGKVGHGRAEARTLSEPDKIRTFPNGTVRFVRVGGISLASWTSEPGWRWSVDVQPVVGTE